MIEASAGVHDGAVQTRANDVRLRVFESVSLQSVELNGTPLPELEAAALADPSAPGWCVLEDGEILASSGPVAVDVEKAFVFLLQP